VKNSRIGAEFDENNGKWLENGLFRPFHGGGIVCALKMQIE
jgi:hypothetical protein